MAQGGVCVYIRVSLTYVACLPCKLNIFGFVCAVCVLCFLFYHVLFFVSNLLLLLLCGNSKIIGKYKYWFSSRQQKNH